ncbi:MAG: amidase domain-containing protein [Actinomycetota bacterium]|nr:amidase domain-containing protein [Actinomycetota bacterium]
MKKTNIVSTLFVLCLLLVILGPTGNAYAYDGNGSASYGESWSSNTSKLRNSEFPDFSNDCTNFASQCMNWGGKVHEKYGSSEATKWYCDKTLFGFTWSNSWSISSYFYNFLRNYNSAIQGSWKAPTANSSTLINNGDMLFYDWDSNGSKDHTGICTAYAADPNSGITGDVQCQHSTDRYRAIWHLKPYNANWSTTTITAVRPSSTL